MSEQEKRELLVRLAENVMGWTATRNASDTGTILLNNAVSMGTIWDCGDPRGWNPLEDIGCAWMLVEALPRVVPTYARAEMDFSDGVYSFQIGVGKSVVDENYPYFGESESVPLAICLAADAATRAAE